jgi:endonuclease/exonuclease/phosphatase family metal-dependent hydrolase
METIRVLTLNLWGEQPPLERRMQLATDGIAALAPDVVALQEARVVPGSVPNQAETLARALGFHFCWEPATPWGGGEEGLALLSRHPILSYAAGVLPYATLDERRIVLGALIATPAGPFAAFTTHLTYRLHDGHKREAQLVAAEARVAAAATDLPKVFMGDFNAVSSSDEIRYLRGLHSVADKRVYYQDAFEACHPGEPGFTWARRNPYTERLDFLEPDRRIDYIFVTARRRDGRGRVRDCRIVLDVPAADGAFASDHFGLMAEIQIAPDLVRQAS